MSDSSPSKRNLIRFPSSRRERRRRLLESKDPRVRITLTLRMTCGWLLVIGVFLFLLTNYQLFTPTSLRSIAQYAMAGIQQHEGDITTIHYENQTFSDAALFGPGLAYADSDALFLAQAGSTTNMRYSLGYADPVVESSKDYVLVYDRGGYSAALTNSAKAVAELNLSSAILNGSISQDGHFVLVTDEQGYRTAVAVYNTRGEEVFKYNSSEYYILSAVLSSDSKTLIVLAFRQDGISLNTHVLFYSVSSGELQGDVMLEDTLGVAVSCLSGSSAAVLCEDGLYVINRNGETEHTLTFASSNLLTCAVRSDSLAVAIRSYSGSARSEIFVIRSDGQLAGPYMLTEEPSSLSISNAGVAALSASGVSVFQNDTQPIWKNSDAAGAQQVLLSNDGTVFALYARNARIFTAHSQNSTELDHAN